MATVISLCGIVLLSTFNPITSKNTSDSKLYTSFRRVTLLSGRGMSKLRDGEKKTLKVLLDGPKTFGKLRKETGLSNGGLTNALKSLQEKKPPLIEKDIQTREYFLIDISHASLYLADIVEFIKEYIEKNINPDLRKGKAINERSKLLRENLYAGWHILTDTIELHEDFTRSLREPEFRLALLKMESVLEDVWDSYILSKLRPEKSKRITKYQLSLLKCMKSFRFSPTEELHEIFKKKQVILAQRKLEKSFPGASIPKEMIQIEANRMFEDLVKTQDLIYNPYNLEDLLNRLKRLDENKVKNSFSEKDIKELETARDFVMDVENRRVYNEFLERRDKERPKILVMHTSWGFQGYLKELANLAPFTFNKKAKKGPFGPSEGFVH